MSDVKFNLGEYLARNETHIFCRQWKHATISPEEDQDIFEFISENLNFELESKIDLCLRNRTGKDPALAVKEMEMATYPLDACKAIAKCEYEFTEGGSMIPSKELIHCLVCRINLLFRVEGQSIGLDGVLRDFDLVLQFHPEKITAKLLYVQSLCLAKLGRNDEALATITENVEKIKSLQNKSLMQKMMTKKNFETLQLEIANKNYEQKILEIPQFKDNKCFSPSVNVAAIGTVIARTRIPCGEIIAMEKSEEASLYFDSVAFNLTHCNHCLQHTLTPLPCPKCCEVVFCSSSCLKLATIHHENECQLGIVPLLTEWNTDPIIRVVYLALRSLWSTDPEQFDHGGQRTTKSSNEQVTRLAKNPYLYRYLQCQAVLCFKIARLSEFFLKLPGNYEDSRQRVLDFLFLKICSIVFESVCILEPSEHSPQQVGKDFELSAIGLGLFPKLRSIRHGCSQNVVSFFKGSTQVIAASRNIDAGEEILVNSLVNLNKPRWGRQSQLAKIDMTDYGGDYVCTCEACKQNWGFELNALEYLESTEDKKIFIAKDLAGILEMSTNRNPLKWLESLRENSSFLEEKMDSQESYHQHGATNSCLLKCLHYAYGIAN